MQRNDVEIVSRFMGSLRNKDPQKRYFLSIDEIDTIRSQAVLQEMGIGSAKDCNALLARLTSDTGFQEELKAAADERHPRITKDLEASRIATIVRVNLLHVLGVEDAPTLDAETAQILKQKFMNL